MEETNVDMALNVKCKIFCVHNTVKCATSLISKLYSVSVFLSQD